MCIIGHGQEINVKFRVPEGFELYFLSYTGKSSTKINKIILFNEMLKWFKNDTNFFEDVIINNTINIKDKNWVKNYKTSLKLEHYDKLFNYYVSKSLPNPNLLNDEEKKYILENLMNEFEIVKYDSNELSYDNLFFMNNGCNKAQYGIYRASTLLINNNMHSEVSPFLSEKEPFDLNKPCLHISQYINDNIIINGLLKDKDGNNLINYKYFDCDDDKYYNQLVKLSDVIYKLYNNRDINFPNYNKKIKILIGNCRPLKYITDNEENFLNNKLTDDDEKIAQLRRNYSNERQ
tara:strand:- start:3421 stop:4293 length:873 start_codon:yes stop_codon:yes gene_type:complete